MKRLLLAAAVFALAACGPRDEAQTEAETTTPPAAAPAPGTDTTLRDTTARDTTRDTARVP